MFEFLKKLNPYYHRAYIRELLALRSKRGPYRFSVRTWQGISDIDLAARVLNTESFRGELEPVPLPVEAVKSILVLAPHQDDETIGSGGSLLLASKAGATIDVVYITDGAQNKSHQPDIIQTREREALKVCSELGAKVHMLGISNLIPQPTIDDVDRLSKLIWNIKPEVVMTPWLLDLPAKHRMVNHLLWLASQRNGTADFEVWGYQVHNTPFVNGYVDITSVAKEKQSLLEKYRSQIDHRRYDHMAMGLGAWNSHFLAGAPDRRYVEVFSALPASEFFGLVRSFYLSDLSLTYRGDSQVISGMTALQRGMTKSVSRRGFWRISPGARRIAKRSTALAVLLAQGLTDFPF
jgi:LmbE family N-acetylglucosaminyl deacetylase